MLRYLVPFLLLSACGSDALYDVQPGTYQVTHRTIQDTGAQESPAAGTVTFTVALVADGLTLDSNNLVLPSIAVPGSGTTYHVDDYSATQGNCEAGPNQMCHFGFQEATVTGTAANAIRVETCIASMFGQCSTSPVCTVETATTTLGANPCTNNGVLQGERVGP